MENISLAEKSVMELKALGFDQIQNLEIARNNLNVINQELANRDQAQLEAKPTADIRDIPIK